MKDEKETAAEALREHLLEHPKDWDARLILADLLEEAGDTLMANAQRWMGSNHKRPFNGRSWFSAERRLEAYGTSQNDPESDLPHALWEALDTATAHPKATCKVRPPDSGDAAERALAVALQRLGSADWLASSFVTSSKRL